MNKGEATDRFYAEIWPHRATVLRTARYFTSSDADADDLAQDTLMKAFSSLDSFEPGSNAKGWLMTILRHTHIDRVRSLHSSDVSLDSLAVDVPDDHQPEQNLDAWQNADQALQAFGDAEIISALKRLPHDICWTLLLVDVEGMDDRDAAKVLKIPAGTVKSRLHRGRRMLRETLAPLAKDRHLGSTEDVPSNNA
jgi:RNA polymerase sigma-70 factor (ECF subfamily)